MDKLAENLTKCIPQHLFVWVCVEIKVLEEKQIMPNRSLYSCGNKNVETIF